MIVQYVTLVSIPTTHIIYHVHFPLPMGSVRARMAASMVTAARVFSYFGRSFITDCICSYSSIVTRCVRLPYIFEVYTVAIKA